MVISKKRLRNIAVIPGVLIAGVLLSSVGLFNQGLGFLPHGLAKLLIVITSMYGAVELLTKIISIFCRVKE